MTRTKAFASVGAIIVSVLMLTGVFALPASVSAANVSAPITTTSTANLNDQITTESGPTAVLGGGDHFFIRFGNDSAFGIVWGTNETPNNVYFVAIKTRYLGVAQVYDEQGALLAGNQTVKIATLYAVKLADILEFNDTDNNGVLTFSPVYNGDEFTGHFATNESIYKYVDLRTVWTATNVTEGSTTDSRTWTFSLTASDLNYTPLANYTGPTGDNKLNNLTLTFNLEANLVQVDNVTIPQWRITVREGMMGMMGANTYMMTNMERMQNLTYSGKIITYSVKWNQTIEGWDFDAANANPKLLMIFQAIVGNYLPPAVVSGMRMMEDNYRDMVGGMGEDGHMSCTGDAGPMQVDNSTGTYSTPRQVATPTLTFGGDNTRIGRLEWVSNVTVDGSQIVDGVHVQVMGGMPIMAMGMNGAVFTGFAAIVGMSFPGGAMIQHDPTFDSSAVTDLSTQPVTTSTTHPLMVIIGLGAVVVAILVVAILALVMMERKPGQKAQQSYEKSTTQQVDWTKYYGKK
jgi:hypothetical protein